MRKKPKSTGGARSNPGQVRTGISRAILLKLSEGPLSIDAILEKLGPHSDGVNHGTVWMTLDRARAKGLVRCDQSIRPHLYALTDGGERRVAWIRGAKAVARRPRAVANPVVKEREEE